MRYFELVSHPIFLKLSIYLFVHLSIICLIESMISFLINTLKFLLPYFMVQDLAGRNWCWCVFYMSLSFCYIFLFWGTRYSSSPCVLLILSLESAFLRGAPVPLSGDRWVMICALGKLIAVGVRDETRSGHCSKVLSVARGREYMYVYTQHINTHEHICNCINFHIVCIEIHE